VTGCSHAASATVGLTVAGHNRYFPDAGGGKDVNSMDDA
jgi:hypothetical protein